MASRVSGAEFVRGSAEPLSFSNGILPEIAFVGRSNVGKSSFINRVVNRKGLARTSSTPGRTQEFNFFKVTLSSGSKEKQLFFVDLPGFGYAEFSKEKRENLSQKTVEYLQNRNELQVICLLNDIRRDPGREELSVRDLAYDSGKYVLVVLTKADKVSKNEFKKRLDELSALYGLIPEDFLISAKDADPSVFIERLLPLLDAPL